jgi:hypothetical protein
VPCSLCLSGLERRGGGLRVQCWLHGLGRRRMRRMRGGQVQGRAGRCDMHVMPFRLDITIRKHGVLGVHVHARFHRSQRALCRMRTWQVQS